MTNQEITQYCMSKRGAAETFPFGEIPICYKVCGKIFMQLYPLDGNHKVTVGSDPMLADYYRQKYPGTVVPGYHCPGRLRPYMNTVYLNQDAEDEVILEMIDHSYGRVVGKLTGKQKAELEDTI